MCARGSKRALLGPKMAKHGRLASPKMVVNGPNGPKWSIQHVFDYLGPYRTYLGSFGSLALRSICELPRVRAAYLEVRSRIASKSVEIAKRSHRGLPRSLMCGSPRGSSEQTLRPNLLILGVFFGPSDRNELYHTPFLSKIWGLGDRNLFVVGSLQEVFLCQKLLLIFCGYQNELYHTPFLSKIWGLGNRKFFVVRSL